LLLLPTLRLPLNDDADNVRELPMRRAMSWLDFREMEDGVEDDRDILPEVASDCSPCATIKLRPDAHEFGFRRFERWSESAPPPRETSVDRFGGGSISANKLRAEEHEPGCRSLLV
jgi:hypothetical protein